MSVVEARIEEESIGESVAPEGLRGSCGSGRKNDSLHEEKCQ